MQALDPNVREKIVSFVRAKGPVLPVQISQAVEVDIIFAGALLSELVSRKLIKISYARIGGSPVYYSEGQESKLESLYKYLPSKEKEAYELLKKKIILNDKESEPSIRVALRAIRDFAVPVKVNLDNEESLFWKWYLASNDEFENKLKEFIGVKDKPTEKIKEVEKVKEKAVKVEKVKEKAAKTERVKSAGEFLGAVNSYLGQNNIKIIEELQIKGKKEINMVVKVPSNLGELELFLCAKDKKKFSDADLTLAYHKGQGKKLPVLLLGNGELTKKAKEYLDKNLRGYLIFKRIS